MTTSTATRTVAGRAFPATGTYAIDPSHSSVEAVARHLVVSKVRGRFGAFSGTITVGEGLEDSRVDVEIDAASIDTRSADRDQHLRSPDFLDVEQHPSLSFRSTRSEAGPGGTWLVHGDLTIRGVSRPVVLETVYEGTLQNPWGAQVAVFSAKTEIDREQWGITWNAALETGGVLVGARLKIELEIQAQLQA
jgi:polyisoprenoid-binding protein YceI